MSILRHWPYALGAIGVALVVALYFAWQHEAAISESRGVEINTLKAELAGSKRREVALERAATERAVDTQIRTDETDKVSDALDRIEHKVKANDTTVVPDAAALAVACSRLRRQGHTASALYRNRCG